MFINAQNDIATPLDSIGYKFLMQSRMFPQEKIYVQIDKPYYITGEDIWFRAHLVDATSNIPDTTSRYVYAELINPIDSVIKRVKIRPQGGAYNGHISLAEDLPEGEYMLRFYTRFQEGLGNDYFFKRVVRIGDPLSALYRTEASFKYEDNNKKVKGELRFVDVENGALIKPDKIQITDNKGTKDVKSDEDDIVRISMNAPNDKTNRTICIEYDYSGKFHKQFITIPYPDNFEVSFLPEGGQIPLGKRCRVAFKSLNSEGVGETISGIVVNEKGDTISDFESRHRGMGYFLFQSSNMTDKYYAICRNEMGMEKRYELPVANSNSVALQIQQQKERTYISVNKSTDMVEDKPLYLIILCRGVVLSATQWDNSKEFIMLPKDILPSGVIQILLVDTDMNPVSERLIFNVNDKNFANVSFSTDKGNYDRREKVNASFNLSGTEGKPSLANFSISITDDNDVKPDTCVNILSSLLLTSELKGYIESPAYYFTEIRTETVAYLDLLMMTQGWSRYNISKVLKGEYEMPKSFLELGPEISGVVKGGILMNRPSANYPVTLLSPEGGIFESTITDDNGRFRFNGFELPDSILYVVQGQTKKGGSRVELILDYETFPKGKYSLPFLSLNDYSQFGNYLGKADQQFVLANGMRMIYLKDVEVTAKSIVKQGKSAYSSPFNPRFTLEEIEKMHATTVQQILSRFAGVMIIGNKISIRGGGTPLVLIDGVEADIDFLDGMPVEDIDEVEIIKDGTAAIFGSRGGNGVIMIATKRGEINTRSKPIFNIKTVTPLGYQTAKEFYSPQYETRQQRDSSTPDLRTTIYWNPSVKTSETGASDISFYTSDASTTYSVVVEGVTSDGLLIHTVEKITRKDK
ncbi:MAG: TonB-dependent receptor plug domain-containing protein [Dysgonomonas sp.]